MRGILFTSVSHSNPTWNIGWGWLLGWGILAVGLAAVLRVMVKKDKVVLKLGSVEENQDGTMTVVCTGYQNKKPLPLDLSHVRIHKGSALIFRQSLTSDLDDVQLTIVLDPLAELTVEVGEARLTVSQNRLRANR
ncbi:hypothetical protein [Holdemania sp. Marseille-P2844]|nr:hypothetical protein [Holdemania sp. Marseille-P2844]